MILLVPKSSHSPLAGAPAPANVSRSLPATPVREPKNFGKKLELPVFSFCCSSSLSFLGEPASRCYAGSRKNFSIILEWFFCQKRGYSISYPPNLADRTSKKIVSFSFLGTPVSVSEQGVPFFVFTGQAPIYKMGRMVFPSFFG